MENYVEDLIFICIFLLFAILVVFVGYLLYGDFKKIVKKENIAFLNKFYFDTFEEKNKLIIDFENEIKAINLELETLSDLKNHIQKDYEDLKCCYEKDIIGYEEYIEQLENQNAELKRKLANVDTYE